MRNPRLADTDSVHDLQSARVEARVRRHAARQGGVEGAVQLTRLPAVVQMPVAWTACGKDYQADLIPASGATAPSFRRGRRGGEVEDEHMAREGGDGEAILGVEDLRRVEALPPTTPAGPHDLRGRNAERYRRNFVQAHRCLSLLGACIAGLMSRGGVTPPLP